MCRGDDGHCRYCRRSPSPIGFQDQDEGWELVSNVLIEAHDEDAVTKRYPGCVNLRANLIPFSALVSGILNVVRPLR